VSVAQDKFVNFQSGLQSPPRNFFVITPSDTNELPTVTRAILGGTGDVKVRLADDTAPQIIKAVAVGTLLPLRLRQVFATGTGRCDVTPTAYS
jgi:hypothetical protein